MPSPAPAFQRRPGSPQARPDRRQYPQVARPGPAPAGGPAERLRRDLRPADPGRARPGFRHPLRELPQGRLPRPQHHPALQGARAGAASTVEDPFIRSIGSLNTVVFEPQGPGRPQHRLQRLHGRLSRAGSPRCRRAPSSSSVPAASGGRFPSRSRVLGADGIRIVDSNAAKAAALAQALGSAFRGWRSTTSQDAASAMKGADGVVNCTPMGMSGYPGSAVPERRACRLQMGVRCRLHARRDRAQAGLRAGRRRRSSAATNSSSIRVSMPSASFPAAAIEDLDGLRAGLNDPAA